LALKRLPAHFAVADDFQAHVFLQADGVVDSAIFDCFELLLVDGFDGELVLRFQQVRRAKQAADSLGVNGEHINMN
jgi:hypothetical protein